MRGRAGAGDVRGGARRSGGAPLRAYVLLSRETICEVEAGRFERRYATKTKLRHLREVQAEPTDFTVGPKHNSPLLTTHRAHLRPFLFAGGGFRLCVYTAWPGRVILGKCGGATDAGVSPSA